MGPWVQQFSQVPIGALQPIPPTFQMQQSPALAPELESFAAPPFSPLYSRSMSMAQVQRCAALAHRSPGWTLLPPTRRIQISGRAPRLTKQSRTFICLWLPSLPTALNRKMRILSSWGGLVCPLNATGLSSSQTHCSSQPCNEQGIYCCVTAIRGGLQ